MLAVISSGCDFYHKNMPFAPIPPQTVSGPVVIGPEWIEIVPPEPLKPLVKSQWINLGYSGYNNNGYSDPETEDSLNLADGRKTKIEAFLFDDKGESYELQLAGVGNGVILDRKAKVEIIDGEPRKVILDFPSDRVYTKLKIRSEIPLKCDKIEWIGSKPQ